jgi:para-aminobenzoate synthetase / 4-amino-4-deoxychorismate lyase
LHNSGKDRAENVMIADMVRNDLSRIARPGSVRVENLFAVQRYPTLWQMVSKVSARTGASLADTFSALFPAASITGAPKARTMAIIRELESEPRRIYTGTIGFVLPDRRAQFNVAIRTLLIDRQNKTAEYGVGGGITADSTANAEWEETRLKSLICRSRQPEFSLLETLLWTPQEGYAYLAEHLHRLRGSADYFSYPCTVEAVRAQLAAAVAGYRGVSQRVRLLLDCKGEMRLETVPFAPVDRSRTVRVALAPHPVDDQDVFLYHKTTRRELYNRMRDGLGEDADDVLLYNRRGEVTETTIANIVVSLDGREYTPPVRCGLLAGTCRQHLLTSGQVTERVISLDWFRSQDTFTLINSVRGRYPGMLVSTG